MADKLASPLAFELCEGGTCGEFTAREDKTVYCKASDDCAKGGCYCQLFKRKKGSDDKIAWEVARTNHENEVKYKPDELDYKCLCVKPILEGKAQTMDGVEYAMRFVLCSIGSCSLDSIKVHGIDPMVQCSGDCQGDCKCTLFRLRIRG